MPTVVRQSFTKANANVIYPWDEASPIYNSCIVSYEAHNNYITSTFGVNIPPWVEISDLEGYQEFIFPTDQAWAEYIENYCKNASMHSGIIGSWRYPGSVPVIPGLARNTTVKKECGGADTSFSERTRTYCGLAGLVFYINTV